MRNLSHAELRAYAADSLPDYPEARSECICGDTGKREVRTIGWNGLPTVVLEDCDECQGHDGLADLREEMRQEIWEENHGRKRDKR